jgi:DNA-binding GntR family transcriptional regulator
MDQETARDVLFARCTLELAAAGEWLSHRNGQLERDQAAAIDAMEEAAASGDMLAAVEADTLFHGALLAAGGRQRLGQLWHSLDSQMGALMRASLERQHSDLYQLAKLHVDLARVLASHDRRRIDRALNDHYLTPATP